MWKFGNLNVPLPGEKGKGHEEQERDEGWVNMYYSCCSYLVDTDQPDWICISRRIGSTSASKSAMVVLFRFSSRLTKLATLEIATYYSRIWNSILRRDIGNSTSSRSYHNSINYLTNFCTYKSKLIDANICKEENSVNL